jgi:hypothetical protein
MLPIRIERERRLIKSLTRIESGNLPRGTPKKNIKTLLDLYTAFLRSEDNRWPNFTEEGRIEFDHNVISNLIGYIKLDPFIKRVEEALVTLHGGDVAKVQEILQTIVDEKDAIASEMQRANRKGKSKDTNYKKLLKEIIQKNPDISAKDLSAKLEKEIGMGVIRDVNYRSDTIVTAIGEEYKISGLKDQIYKLRKSGI